MNLANSARATMEPPSELVGPVPRKVRLNFGGDARYLVLAILPFFVGGGIALAWMCNQDFQEFQHRAALRRDGHVVVGTVTHPTRGFTNYTFSAAGGSYPGRARESLFPSEFPHPSDPILIRFVPDNPAINHPASWEWTVYVGLENILDTLFFAIGAFSLFYLWRYRTLARKGSVATGVVLSCVLKDRFFHTEYEFRTPDGKAVRGHIDRKQEFEAGATVWVLYLPQRPRTNDLYPPTMFDISG